jgi:excisionase family DNA binding protein
VSVTPVEAALAEFIRAIVREELDLRLANVTAGPERAWLTVGEAAEQLACSTDAVRMRVRRGRLKGRKQGRRLYVSADSIQRLG